jgi:hypothetical protein
VYALRVRVHVTALFCLRPQRRSGKIFCVVAAPSRRRCDTLAPLVLNNKRAAVCFIMKNPHRLLDDFSSSYIALNKHLPAARERGASFFLSRAPTEVPLVIGSVCLMFALAHSMHMRHNACEFRDHEVECSI